jgi:hypothetical protein
MRTLADTFTNARPLGKAARYATADVLLHYAGVVDVLEQREGEVEGLGWV